MRQKYKLFLDDAGNAQVMHVGTRKTVPYSATEGGGNKFDIWHSNCMNGEQGRKYCEFLNNDRKPLTFFMEDANSLADLKTAAPLTGTRADWIIMDDVIACKQEETETAMYNEIQEAKSHLLGELDRVLWEKRDEAQYAYGIRFKAPTTVGEIKQFIDKGWVRVNTSDLEDDYEVYNPSDYLTWGDPKVKRDAKGFNAAEKLISEAFRTAKNVILIFSPEKGLNAVETFRAQKF